MKTFLRLFLSATLFVAASPLLAQVSADWREYIRQMVEDGLDDDAATAFYEDLSDLESNPLNINDVSLADLERLPFLSGEQQRSVLQFLEKNRPVYSVYELRNVPLLDVQTVQLLLPFFVVGEYQPQKPKLSWKNIFEGGKHELQSRYDRVFPQRAGYKSVSDSILKKSPNRVYQGEDFYQSLRYAYKAGRRFQAGITAEKDAGETFFRGEHKGYDHYGAFVQLKDVGRLKALVVGDYRMRWGQGLLLNNNFLAGKSSQTVSVVQGTALPTRHASTAESGFFRGAAATYQVGNVALTAFYSHRKVDANFSKDSMITSFKTDGLHRTLLEISKRNNVTEQVAGGNVRYVWKGLQLGTSFVYNKFDHTVKPNYQEYNKFYFAGDENWGVGIDYGYRLRRWSFAGETSMSKNGSFATLNALIYTPKRNLTFSLLQRHYSRSYQAHYANAFSDGSSVRNEQGWYLGVQTALSQRLRLSAYVDVVSFPWLKSGINEPSKAFDGLLYADYSFSRQSRLEARYRFRQREKNMKYPDKKTTTVLPYDQHKMLLQFTHHLSSAWVLRTVADANFYKVRHHDAEQGWMLSQMVSWRPRNVWQADAFVSYFKADDYNARLYSRERNLTSTFYMPMLYNHGVRGSLAGRCNIRPNLSLAVKCGISKYFDRQSIGSGLEQIDAKHRIDVLTHLRWVF